MRENRRKLGVGGWICVGWITFLVLVALVAAILFSQLLIGLINGSFYALLSLGLAVIFGLLNIINFTHGAQYMMGAFVAWGLLEYLGLSYWWALILAPLVVAVFGVLMERVFLRHLYHVDHVYALLLTFGVALLMEGAFRLKFGVSGQPYPSPLAGGVDLGRAHLRPDRALDAVP